MEIDPEMPLSFECLSKQASEAAVNQALDESFSEYDKALMELDITELFVIFNMWVSKEVEETCRAEMANAQKSGWKRLRDPR
jgi:hypothetical protein